MIEEATRERFLFAYKRHNATSTVDFIKRAIEHFEYMPKEIQTDNGKEFTNSKRKGKSVKTHVIDKFLEGLGMAHKKIKPRTPRHNGKAERSHRNDKERFYNGLRFETIEELQEKMKTYNERSNNIPSLAILDKDEKRKWLSPNDKRKELKEAQREKYTPTDTPLVFLSSNFLEILYSKLCHRDSLFKIVPQTKAVFWYKIYM